MCEDSQGISRLRLEIFYGATHYKQYPGDGRQYAPRFRVESQAPGPAGPLGGAVDEGGDGVGRGNGVRGRLGKSSGGIVLR